MAINNQLRIGACLSFAVLFTSGMASRFLIGFVAGVLFSSKYDTKPYVNLIEDKLINLQKEIEVRRLDKEQKGQNKWLGQNKWPW